MLLYRLIAIAIGVGTSMGLAVLGHLIFDAVALPDLCQYHLPDVKTGWLFDLFFPMTAANGYHPGPGMVFHLTALIGGTVAGTLFLRWMKGRS
jgi:hypothetical protein